MRTIYWNIWRNSTTLWSNKFLKTKNEEKMQSQNSDTQSITGNIDETPNIDDVNPEVINPADDEDITTVHTSQEGPILDVTMSENPVNTFQNQRMSNQKQITIDTLNQNREDPLIYEPGRLAYHTTRARDKSSARF